MSSYSSSDDEGSGGSGLGAGGEAGANGGLEYLFGPNYLEIPELRLVDRAFVGKVKPMKQAKQQVGKIRARPLKKLPAKKPPRNKRARTSSLDKINIEQLVARTWEQLTDEERFKISKEDDMRLKRQAKENPVKLPNYSSTCLCFDCSPSTSTTLLSGAINGAMEDRACGRAKALDNRRKAPPKALVNRRKAPPKKRAEREAEKAAAKKAAARRRPRKPRAAKPRCGKKVKNGRVAKPKAKSSCFRPIPKPKRAADCPKKGKK
ncbi:histone H5-like [Drosophila willistoni]|uniref:histone H5-like n=1 Tax=Drosophila willistoni TaxID=7260 RepID=UPI00017D7F1B|nr:histone H5-like [Drosophila willistoni]